MTDVFLNLVDGEWVETTPENSYKDSEGNSFSLNELLRQRLDRVSNLVKDKWDAMFIIDGRERSGKSSLACVCAWYLTKGKMTVDNFASGLQDCAKKIAKIPNGSVLILDEGSTMFGSKDSTSKAQKQLIKILDVVGQKNLIFIVCLPCFFDLNKTIAIRRSLFLIHIAPKVLKDRWKREPFYYFDEKGKSILYREGKKHNDSYRFPYPSFDGKYYAFKPPFWDEYEKTVKRDSLQQVLDDATGNEKGGGPTLKNRHERGQMFLELKNALGLTNRELAERFNLSPSTISIQISDYNHSLKQIASPPKALEGI